jgi:hypothetical protein
MQHEKFSRAKSLDELGKDEIHRMLRAGTLKSDSILSKIDEVLTIIDREISKSD